MDKAKARAEKVAYHNQIVVMDLVRRCAPLSRADIARHTGFAVQTVSNIVEILLRSDLLLERRRREKTRGQPPIDLRINPSARYALGASLDGRRLNVVLCDFVGEEIACRERDLKTMHPDTVLPAVAKAARALADENDIDSDRLLGMGLVMPGLTSHGHFGRLVREHPWRDLWSDRPFIQELSDSVGLPILTDNDRTAAALSERLSGSGRDVENFLFVYFGSGIGGGLVISGIPYRGREGRAGEIGHMVVAPGGRACSCGNRGCLERYASLQALQSALTGRSFDADPIDTVMLARAVGEANPVASAWLDEAAEYLRTAIVTLENVLDIDTIFLGGMIPDAILEALMERLESLPPSVSSGQGRTMPRLRQSVIGRFAAARGAASLVVLDSTVPDFSRFDPAKPLVRTRQRSRRAAASG